MFIWIDLYTDNIFLTQTIDGVEEKGYIRVTPEDMSIHTGLNTGRNFKLRTLDKNFTIYSGEYGDNRVLEIIKDEKINIYSDLILNDKNDSTVFDFSYISIALSISS